MRLFWKHFRPMILYFHIVKQVYNKGCYIEHDVENNPHQRPDRS